MTDPLKKVSKPHDLFFKRAMSNIHLVEEFIQNYFPRSIANKIDPGSLQLTDGSFIDKDFNEYRTDILYKATFHGLPGYIYLLIEAQRKADRLMPLRMLEYTTQILRRNLEKNKNSPFPLVFPCVIHNGEAPYFYTTDIFEMFQDPTLAREIFLNPFHLIDLPSIEDNDLKKSPLFGMVALYLKHAYTRDVLGFIKRVADVLKQVELSNEIALLEAGAYYLFQTNKDGTSRYDILNEFKTHLNPKTQQEIMTIAEAFIAEGRKEGRKEGLQEGLQEGMQKGEAALLIKLLNRRFPAEVTNRHLFLINEADQETLSSWGEKLMDAKNLDEIFVDFLS